MHAALNRPLGLLNSSAPTSSITLRPKLRKCCYPCPPHDESGSGLLNARLYVCFLQVPHGFLLLKTTAPSLSLLQLVPNLPVGLYRLEIDHMRKTSVPAVILSHPGERILAGFGALPRRVNECISADDCEARKD